MDQIKKRLEIIKIAIFMSDDETIRLQLLKLEYFHQDEELEKIINLLKHKKYAQAQVLISQYLNNYNDTNKKNSENNSDLKQVDNKNSIIEEFGLLKSNNSSSKHAVQSSHQNTKQNKTKDYITSYVTNYKDFKLSSDEIEKIPLKKQTIQKETIQSVNKSETSKGDLEMSIDIDTKTIKAYENDSSCKKDLQNRQNNNHYDTKYPPLSDIFLRFQNIALLYTNDKNHTLHKSAANWMHRISKFGYKDIEILKISKHIQSLKENKQYDEAIQLTIICGATESNLGKLIFARELYKGDIFEKDYIKAYEITKELALMNYPEALCDLGQYCEHGIGTEKNQEYALHFYKKANDLGLERAHNLYKNLKQKRGFFSFLFKSEY